MTFFILNTENIYFKELFTVFVRSMNVCGVQNITEPHFMDQKHNNKNYQQRTNIHIERALVDLFFPQDTMESKFIYKIGNVE